MHDRVCTLLVKHTLIIHAAAARFFLLLLRIALLFNDCVSSLSGFVFESRLLKLFCFGHFFICLVDVFLGIGIVRLRIETTCTTCFLCMLMDICDSSPIEEQVQICFTFRDTLNILKTFLRCYSAIVFLWWSMFVGCYVTSRTVCRFIVSRSNSRRNCSFVVMKSFPLLTSTTRVDQETMAISENSKTAINIVLLTWKSVRLGVCVLFANYSARFTTHYARLYPPRMRCWRQGGVALSPHVATCLRKPVLSACLFRVSPPQTLETVWVTKLSSCFDSRLALTDIKTWLWIFLRIELNQAGCQVVLRLLVCSSVTLHQ